MKKSKAHFGREAFPCLSQSADSHVAKPHDERKERIQILKVFATIKDVSDYRWTEEIVKVYGALTMQPV